MKKILFFTLIAILCWNNKSFGQATSLYRNNVNITIPKKEFIEVSKDFKLKGYPFIKIIKNALRNIEVREGSEGTLRITAKLDKERLINVDKDSLWNKAKIEVQIGKDSVTILPVLGPTNIPTRGGATNIKPGDLKLLKKKQLRQNSYGETIIIYIPKSSKLYIESSYSEVRLYANNSTTYVSSNNCYIEGRTIGKIDIDGKYTDISLFDVKSAKINNSYGIMNIQKALKLTIQSEVCEIQIDTASSVQLTGQYNTAEVGRVNDINVNKKNGELRISRLTGSIDFKGDGTTLKIGQVSNDAHSVKINNKLADIHIGIENLKNFSVRFHGDYSTFYSPFKLTPQQSGNDKFGTYRSSSDTGNAIMFEIACPDCKIVMK